LFDFRGGKLDFEIARMFFRQFIHSEENWLEPRQLRSLVDLLVEEPQLIERILVFRSHDAILPYASFRLVIGSSLADRARRCRHLK
jgi:hypothetical protein